MPVTPSDLARTLLARHRRRLEEDRRKAEDLRRLLREELRAWSRETPILRAWLIGSLASGLFGAGSDVDVVVEGLARERFCELWSRLTARLGCEVDLLCLDELPESFRERVASEGVPLDVA